MCDSLSVCVCVCKSYRMNNEATDFNSIEGSRVYSQGMFYLSIAVAPFTNNDSGAISVFYICLWSDSERCIGRPLATDDYQLCHIYTCLSVQSLYVCECVCVCICMSVDLQMAELLKDILYSFVHLFMLKIVYGYENVNGNFLSPNL